MYLILSTIVFAALCNQLSISKSSNITSCTPNICGPNADCFDDKNDLKFQMYGEPYCKCFHNTQGSPPNCKSLCSVECASDEYCNPYENICMKGCRSDRNCELDEFCFEICRKGCRSDLNCESGKNCVNNECVKKCENHEDCSSDEYCENLECLLGCRSDDSCNTDEYCDSYSHKCLPGFCSEDTKCDDDEFCDDEHKCTKVCFNNNICGKNGKCLGKDHKRHCSCIEGYSSYSKNNSPKTCKLIQANNSIPMDDTSCVSFCGIDSECEIIANTMYCYCEYKFNINNPFKKCYFPRSSNPQNTDSQIKPGQETSLSQCAIQCLCCG